MYEKPLKFLHVFSNNSLSRQRSSAFLYFLAQRFIEDRCLQAASALAYTSLLSLVPLMALIFNTLSAFPAFKAMEADIQNFVFSNFVPASSQVIQEYLQTFMQKTSKLTVVGIAALIVTALLMLKTIDGALNTIWRTRRRRRALSSFMVYWAILTLGPLLVGVGIFTTSYLISLPLFSKVEQTTWQIMLSWVPFFTTTTAFTLLYMLIPNRAVPWLSALSGGVVAALLFEAAKKGFALYVTHSDVYETIYGALATIPIFLVWIYVSWVMILLGAEVAYCLTSFKWEERGNQVHESDSKFMLAYRLIGRLWQAQRNGRSLSLEELLDMEHRGDESRLLRLLDKLEQENWIYRTDEGMWAISRDLGETKLIGLYRLMSGGLSTLPEYDDLWSRNLQPLLLQVNQQSSEIMDVPLKELYQRQESEKNGRVGVSLR